MASGYDLRNDSLHMDYFEQYLGVENDDAGFSSAIFAKVVENTDDDFSKPQFKTVDGLSYLSADRLVIGTIIQQLSKFVPTSGVKPADLFKTLGAEVDEIWKAGKDAQKEVDLYNWSVSVAKRPVSDAFIDFTDPCRTLRSFP